MGHLREEINMETKINLEDCYLNKETMQYCCWNQNEDGQIVYEETPAFNLNGTDDILADVCGDRSGKVKVTLKEKKLSDFEQVRVLLAGVKNQEIYILPVTDVQSDCEFTIDTSILLPAMEYGRNKSVRILLETIADGQYFRYRLADKGRAKQDKDLQKGKKVWICEQACSEKLLLTQEGAKDIAYTLCVYMDQKGRWLFGLCANWRIHKMTQMCHLRYLTINKNLLKLRLVTDADKYGYFPDTYELVGFDNSPIASEAILPITTVGQQIDLIAKTSMELLVQQMEERKKRKPVPLAKPIHKQITPVLIRRKTTS